MLLDLDERHRGNDYICPVHDDNKPSLGVALKNGTVLVSCGAGCKTAKVMKALGLSMNYLSNGQPESVQKAVYGYTDENGEPLFEVVRLDPKEFRQRRLGRDGKSYVWNIKGVRRVLYRLPQVRDAIERGVPIHLAEGEEDVQAIERAGGVATCNPGGAGKFTKEQAKSLRGAVEVIIVADRDGPAKRFAGERHAMDASKLLSPLGIPNRIVQARDGKDASDHLAAGHGLDDFEEFRPPPDGADVSSEDEPEFRWTDTGNARRLVALFGDRIRYCPAHKAWYVWNGSIWARDETLEIVRLAKATVREMWHEVADIEDKGDREKAISWCRSSEATSKLNAMIENARSEVVVEPTALDADPYALSAENGTIDLRTGKLRPHDPADLITRMAPEPYDPDAKDERWEEVLDRFVRNDDGKEEFLQRAAFASLTGAISDKAFLNLYDEDEGNTGKTTFIESLLATAGPYGAVVNAESFLTNRNGTDRIRADLAGCYGKRMVVSSEVPPGRHLDTALMKKLTSGLGDFLYERKYENPWRGPITFTIWLDGNTVAKANVEDNPLFDRWKLTPFKHRIGKPDKRWIERAVASVEFRSAVLAWVMRGRKAWLKGGMGTALSVEAATAEVRASMDPLAEFWKEECRFGEDVPGDRYFATTAELRERLGKWYAAKPGNPRVINEADFLRLLKARGVHYKARRVNKKLVKGWVGVRVRAKRPGEVKSHVVGR